MKQLHVKKLKMLIHGKEMIEKSKEIQDKLVTSTGHSFDKKTTATTMY